jgi:hypothetical protein
MPSAGFEPKIPASERPQTHALDRAATAIGEVLMVTVKEVTREGLRQDFHVHFKPNFRFLSSEAGFTFLRFL